MLKIQAVSDSHQFNWETMDVSHTVNHLSFGPFLSETAWAVLPPHIAAGERERERERVRVRE